MKYDNLLKKSILTDFFSFEEIKNLKIKVIPQNSFIYKDCDYSEVLFILSGAAIFCHNQINKYVYMPIIFEKNDFLGDTMEKNDYRGSFDYFTIAESIVVYIPRDTMAKWKKSSISLVTYLYETTAKRDFRANIYQYIRFEKGLLPSLAFVIDLYRKNNIFLFKNTTALALRFNSTRKSMHYALKKLEENNIIQKEKNKLIILDFDLLKKIYEEDLLNF